MTNILWPVTGYNRGPVAQVQPFVYDDAVSVLDILYKLKKWLMDDLIPVFDSRFEELQKEIDALVIAIDVAIAESEERTDAKIADLYAMIQAIIDNSIEAQDPVVAGLIDQLDSATRIALDKLLFDTTSVINVTANPYNAVGDGVTDDYPAIRAAVDAAAPYSTIRIPEGTYKISNFISNHGKPLKFDATGATIVKDGAHHSAILVGAYDPLFGVSSVSPITIQEGDRQFDGVQIVLGGIADWTRGDIVKIISSDIIPGTRDEGSSIANQMRLGQFFTVYDVIGTTVRLRGSMVDTFTQNIRATRYQNVPASWVGGTFDVTEQHMSNGVPARTIEARDLLNPLIHDVKIKRSTSVAFGYVGCYNGVLDNFEVDWAWNELSIGALGYCVANFSTQGLTVTRGQMNSARSGYTDGTGFTAIASNNVNGYGRPMNTRISDISVVGCGTGLGTHSSGVFTMINNCIIRDCYSGISFRGHSNRATGIQIMNAVQTGIRVYTELNSRTYGNVIENVTIDGCDIALQADLNGYSESPAFGTREVRPNTFRNVSARNVKGFSIRSINATLDIDNLSFELVRDVAASASSIINSLIRGTDLRYNVDRVTVGGGSGVFWLTGDPSRIEIDGVRVRGQGNRFDRVVQSSSADVVRLDSVALDSFPAVAIHSVMNADSWVTYRINSANAASSATIAFNTAQTTDPSALQEIAWKRDDFLTVRLTTSAGTTVAALPRPAFRGQIMALVNNGSNSITLRHGTEFGTRLAGSGDVDIPAGSAMLFTGITDVWQQIKTF